MASRQKLDCQALWAMQDDPEWYRPAGWSRFLPFYEAEVGGERLYEAEVDDAALFVGAFSWRVVVIDGKHIAAEAELTRLTRHPELPKLEGRERAQLTCQLALCVLAQGRETEALPLLRSALDLEDERAAWVAARFVRNHLLPGGLCPLAGGKELASEGLTRLVGELAGRISDGAPPPAHWPVRASFAQLRRRLRSTFPPESCYPDIEGEDILDTARLMCEAALQQIRAELQGERQETGP